MRGGTRAIKTHTFIFKSFSDDSWKNVMFCAIWYHLYNLKNVKNTDGGVLLLVKLQTFSLQIYFTKSNTLP